MNGEVVMVSSMCTAGQAVWVPGAGGKEEEVVCVGWENKPRKLGFVYCLNRPSALYHAHLVSGKISEYWSTTIVHWLKLLPSSHPHSCPH